MLPLAVEMYTPTTSKSDEWTARHFLCERRWPDGRARPIWELLATDGERIRRMRSLPEYIALQEFRAPDAAETIVCEVEQGPNRRPGLQGYSSAEDKPVVALFRTDDGDEPAWAVFDDDQLEGAGLTMPSLPESALEAPSLRLAGGATMAWRDWYWVVQAALEQKGETFLHEQRSLNLLDHISDWSLKATVGAGKEHDELDLVDRSRPETKDVRVGPHRMETAFALDETMYDAHVDEPGWQCWFVFEFDESLLCLPRAWRTFWMTVDVSKPEQ